MPCAVAKALGRYLRNCSSFVISLVAIVIGIDGYTFSIHVLVECRELYERHIDFAALPAVEAYDHLMDGEKQVVIRLLQGLGDGVKLALVAAAVVGLRLARH